MSLSSLTDRLFSSSSLLGASTSGYGEKCCPPVVDPYTWLALIGGIALATFFLQQLIVMTTFGKRRKRREIEDITDDVHQSIIESLDEFNEEVEETHYDEIEIKTWKFDSWMNETIKDFLQIQQEVQEDLVCEFDYNSDIPNYHKGNFTTEKCEEKQRIANEPTSAMLYGTERCKVEVWRCFSTVLEGMVKHLDNSNQVYGYLSKVLYKLTFHGADNSMWTSAMAIPEVQSAAHCLAGHDSCVVRHVLRQGVDSYAG